MNRPAQLYDTLYDFNTNNTIPFYNLIDVEIPSLVTVGNTITMTYGVRTDSNIPVTNLYVNPNNSTLNIGQYFIDVTNQSNYPITRKITAPGLNTDEINIYETLQGSGGFGDGFQNITGQIDGGLYNYYVIQESIAILKETVGSITSVVSTGSQKNINVNEVLSFDVSFCRGAEVSKNVIVYKKNTSNAYVPAISGVDFDVIVGDIFSTTTDTFQIRFLNGGEFRINLTTEGYTSDNNPWLTIGDTRTKVNQNSSTVVYYINSGGVVSNVNTITIPKIVSTVSSAVILSTNPTTTYENVEFTISSVPDVSTGNWIVQDVLTQVPSVRSLTQQEWIDEINIRCDLSLEIKNSNGTLALPIKYGFGPHTVILPKGEYTFQFKTTKK